MFDQTFWNMLNLIVVYILVADNFFPKMFFSVTRFFFFKGKAFNNVQITGSIFTYTCTCHSWTCGFAWYIPNFIFGKSIVFKLKHFLFILKKNRPIVNIEVTSIVHKKWYLFTVVWKWPKWLQIFHYPLYEKFPLIWSHPPCPFNLQRL